VRSWPESLLAHLDGLILKRHQGMLPRGVMNKMNKLASSGTRHNICDNIFYLHERIRYQNSLNGPLLTHLQTSFGVSHWPVETMKVNYCFSVSSLIKNINVCILFLAADLTGKNINFCILSLAADLTENTSNIKFTQF
jgi:hypothetical protein